MLIERRVASPLVDIAANAKPALLRTNIASLCVGFALFASFIGTAAYVQAPVASGYGFGASIVVGGLCLLPSGLGPAGPVTGLGADIAAVRPQDHPVHRFARRRGRASRSASR